MNKLNIKKMCINFNKKFNLSIKESAFFIYYKAALKLIKHENTQKD